MSHEPANFGGQGSWPLNLWKGLKVETTLKIWMIFLSFIDKMVVQFNEQVELHSLVK